MKLRTLLGGTAGDNFLRCRFTSWKLLWVLKANGDHTYVVFRKQEVYHSESQYKAASPQSNIQTMLRAEHHHLDPNVNLIRDRG